MFAYDLLKETVVSIETVISTEIPKETIVSMETVIFIEVKVHSLDGDTDFFDIVAGVLQGDTQASYLFIICLDYILRTSIDKIKENSFKLTKKKEAEDTPQKGLPMPTMPMI